jgi:hypothetical protein
MQYKENLPRFFLDIGSILIFISIFLEWDIITNIITGETRIEYGYERVEVIILFIISLIPIIMYEKGIRFASYYILIIFAEVVVFTLSNRVYIAIYAVDTGTGYYCAMTGGVLQLFGVIVIILIEWFQRRSSPPIDPNS